MLTDDGLASLRMAATLALTLPTVRVQVAAPTRVLAEVGWQLDTDGGCSDGVRLRPCAFRVAVGRAWNQRRNGVECGASCWPRSSSPTLWWCAVTRSDRYAPVPPDLVGSAFTERVASVSPGVNSLSYVAP
jgi:hypothetical protein